MVKIVTHILFPTDFSPSSTPAFRYAVEWAKVFEAQLTILHVHSLQPGLDIDAGVAQQFLDEQRKVAREELDSLVAEARQQVPRASMELLAGLPSECICEVARGKKCDLIMMGTHGWTGFNRVLFGSVAERVIQRAPCPVLSIPHRESADISAMHDLQILPRQIVLPLEFSDCSMDAYEYAVQIAKWFDVPLTLVHAIEPLSYSLDFTLTHPLQEKTNRDKVEKRLADLTAVLIEQGLSAQYELLDKPTVDGILETSAIQQADLIIMGSHGRKGLTRMILGSTAYKLLEQSPYPVLTIKSPKFEGGHHPSPANGKTTSSPA
ncbi:universal stress protein [Candidatus Nitrospira allomarina]|jgi:nucleotide-binding universal stress UspA family protein|uniref:Universal stress protein n=1 Tax=Candidatus Nitrospira allomarina TaxID=3020900 RepID=A0AA96GJA1_9BACT|nr:universal stress protein [Candidatus Nitrospira allomarina]WNM59973.1 universal stress protein [Candidatus Nitrospira allomarina]